MSTISTKLQKDDIRISIRTIQRYMIFIISLLASVFIVYQDISYGGYNLIFLLPLAFGLFHIIFPAVWNFRKGHVGMTIFNAVMFVRFLIIPVFRSLTDNYQYIRGIVPYSESVQTGIWLMIFELFICFVFIQIFAKRIYKNNPKTTVTIKSLRSNSILLLVILGGILTVLIFPSILERYQFVIIQNEIQYSTTQLDIPLNGLFTSLVYWSSYIIPLVLINAFKKRYDKHPSFLYVILSFISFLPVILFSNGTSRISVLIPGIAFMVVLYKLYPKYQKKIIKSGILLITLIFVSITAYKTFGITLNGGTKSNTDFDFTVYTLDSYFSGPYNMGLAVDTEKKYGDLTTIKTLFNDSLISVAMIGNFIDSENVTPHYYNYTAYGKPGVNDQIIPMTGQGLNYFGFILSPLIILFALYLMMKFDNKIIKEERMEFAFIYCFATVFLSMAMMLNISIITPRLTNYFIPLLLIFLLNRKFVIKK